MNGLRLLIPGLMLLTMSAEVSAQTLPDFDLVLMVTDSNGGVQNLTLGISPAYDDAYVLGEDVEGPPSLPPGNGFGAAIDGMDGSLYLEDYRESAAGATLTYVLEHQTTDYPITISWNNALIPQSVTATLQDAFGGGIVAHDMADTNSVVIQASTPLQDAAHVVFEIADVTIAPSNLTAQAQSSSEILVQWTDNSDDEIEFELELSTDGGAIFNPLVTRAADVTSFGHTGLTQLTEYCYRVRAIGPLGPTTYSNEVCETTPVQSPGPDAPSDLAAIAVDPQTIDLTWSDNSADEDGFELTRTPAFAAQQIVGPNVVTFTDTLLTPGVEYCYSIVAFNESGNSDVEGPVCETTPDAPLSFEPSGFNFGTLAVGSTDDGTFAVNTTVGSPTIDFVAVDSATSSAPTWLTGIPSQTTAGTDVLFTVDANGLTVGPYSASVIASVAGDGYVSDTLLVRMSVVDAPECALVADLFGELTVVDGTDVMVTLRFAEAPGATTGFDENCDKAVVGSPGQGLDAYFSGDFNYLTDYRPPLVDPDSVTIWEVNFTSTNPGDFTFDWTVPTPPDSGRLVLMEENGAFEPIDMATVSTMPIPTGVDKVQIVHQLETEFSRAIQPKWNFFAPPLEPTNASYTVALADLLPSQEPLTHDGSAFVFVDDLELGSGYFLLYASLVAPDQFSFEGYGADEVTLTFNRAGWHPVGGPGCTVPVSSVEDPQGLIHANSITSFDEVAQQYAGSAPTDITAGNAYWFFVVPAAFDAASDPKTIRLECLAAPSPAVEATSDSGNLLAAQVELTVSHATNSRNLIVGLDEHASDDLDSFDVLAPPPPPSGVFDARIRGNAYDYFVDVRPGGTSETSFDVTYQRAEGFNDPIILSWDPSAIEDVGRSVTLTDGFGGQTFSLDMTTVGSVEIDPQSVLSTGFVIRIGAVSVGTDDVRIPDEFHVDGNYPNPFSASTTLVVDLPEPAVVLAEVFDVRGARVLEFRQGMAAGHGHRLSIEGAALPAGVFFYRISTTVAGNLEARTGSMMVVH